MHLIESKQQVLQHMTCVVCGRFLGDYGDAASHTGLALAVTTCGMAILDIAFGIYVMYCACCYSIFVGEMCTERSQIQKEKRALLVSTLRY